MRPAKLLLGLLAVLLATLPNAARSEESVPFRLPSDVAPTYYQLDFDIDPDQERFSGEAQIGITLDRSMDAFWLHGRNLDISDVLLFLPDGREIAATYEEVDESGYAHVTTATPIGPGAATLRLRYDAPFDDSLRGIFRVESDAGFGVYTHMEPTRARLVFPAFDEPRFKVPFDISITTTGSNLAVSNAPEGARIDLGDGRTRFVFETTPPLPTYLIALAVGAFDVVDWAPLPPNDVRSWEVPLRGIAPKGKGPQMAFALEQTAGLMAVLEDYFAIPFPYPKLDLVAVPVFGPSGMENVGAIFYRAERIFVDETSSRWQRDGFIHLHAHELAHSWFGDLVTPAWWDDLWLNESFATWMSTRAMHDWRPELYDDRGPQREAKEAMRSDRLPGAQTMRQPMEDEDGIASAFSGIVYSKGAAVLAMTERFMGPEAFRDGVRLFIADHADGVATAADFLEALSEAADDPEIERAFVSFLDQAGIPLVAVDWSCDESGSAAVTLVQSRSLPLGAVSTGGESWTIPLCLAYQQPGSPQSHCLMLDGKVQSLSLPTPSCPAWIHANGGGAAYLNFTLPAAGWSALLDDLPDLPPAEQLSVLASIEAAYEAGRVDTKLFLRAAEIAARSPHTDVVRAPMQGLRHLKLFVVPREQRTAVLERFRGLYREALARFELNETTLSQPLADDELEELRGELLWFMALDAEDPELRALLSGLGQAYLGFGSDGALHPEVLNPNAVRTALIVAAGEAGPEFVEALIALLRTTDDPVLFTHVLRALAYQVDEATVRREFALILDPSFPGYDASELLRRLGQKADNNELIFDWMVANWDALVARLPSSHIRWLPWRISAFCSEEDYARAEAFFAPRMDAYPGGERTLQEVLEKIALCAAIAEVQKPGAIEAITAAD